MYQNSFKHRTKHFKNQLKQKTKKRHSIILNGFPKTYQFKLRKVQQKNEYPLAITATSSTYKLFTRIYQKR